MHQQIIGDMIDMHSPTLFDKYLQGVLSLEVRSMDLEDSL